MAHFAKVEDGVVTDVVVADDAQWCEENLGGMWIQTSYNTSGGVHYGPDGQPDGGVALNKNYAGIGCLWDGIGFYEPQPYPSWTFDSETYLWSPPVPIPNDGKLYNWNEEKLNWEVYTNDAV